MASLPVFEAERSDDGKQRLLSEEDIYEQLPLDSSLGDIRLLAILPCENPMDDIECQLMVVSTEVFSAEFSALSYCWQDGDLGPQTIIVNFTKVTVTGNLYLALRRLRCSSEPRVLWVDAICINQNDDDEKTHQIRRMAEVYSQAQTTYIWLGEESAESNEAFDRIYSHQGLRMIFRGLGPDGVQFEQYESFLSSIKHILQRRWFRRLWVLQELALSQNPRAMWGSREMPWNILGQIIEFAFHKVEKGMKADALGTDLPIYDIYMLKRLRESRAKGQVWTLSQLVHAFGHFECRDERDRFLGLVGLASDAYVSELRSLGYHQSVAEVWTEATKYTLRASGNLDLMCNKVGPPASVELPSWVPNWAISPQYNPLLLEPREIFRKQRFQADGMRLFSALHSSNLYKGPMFGRPSQHSTQAMLVEGFIVHKLEETAPVFEHSLTTSEALFQDHLKQIAKVCFDPTSSEGSLQSTSYPRGQETYEQALVRTLKVDSNQRLLRMLWDEKADLPSLDCVTLESLGQQAAHLCGYRAMRTICRHIGWVPARALSGDVICVLLGCSVPVVLREFNNDAYSDQGRQVFQLIGACYVHGIMDGEGIVRKTQETLQII